MSKTMDRQRSTGRTTRMLKKALELSATHAVYVVGADATHLQHLKRSFGGMGGDPTAVSWETFSTLNLNPETLDLHGAHPRCVVLVDHFAIEHRFAKLVEMLHAFDEDRDRSQRQEKTATWCRETFGANDATNLTQRGLRLLEEATETAQACAVWREQAHRVVDVVYDRPIGEIKQELGGVGVTVLVLAAAVGVDADTCEADEVARIVAKDPEHFRRRNAEKNALGLVAGCTCARKLPGVEDPNIFTDPRCPAHGEGTKET